MFCVRHNTPNEYRASSFCRSCGRDFTSDTNFERHRTGVHEYTYSEGVNSDPSVENGRRCKTNEELLEDGMRPMTIEEMQSTKRHAHRVGFDIEMWFDPAELERSKNYFES